MEEKKIKKFIKFLGYFLCILFTVAGILVSIHRYKQFDVFYYDFGIYNQAIYKVSKFQTPIIDHYRVGGKHIFSDHFHPMIFLLSPLYWFSNDNQILLVAQAVIVGIGALILFRLALKKLRSPLASLAVLCSYIFYIGLQNAVITDFHPLVVATPVLILMYRAIINKNLKQFIIFFLLMLLFKESLFVHGIGVAIFIYFYNKKWRKIAIGTAIFSLLYAFISIKVIIAYFSDEQFAYVAHSFEQLKQIALYGLSTKITSTLKTFGSFAFIPLLNPSTLPITLSNLFIRFVSKTGSEGVGMHYNAEIAPVLAISVLLVLIKLEKRISKQLSVILKKIKLSKTKFINLLSLLIILNSLILYRFLLHGPFALAYNPAFYRHSQEFGFLENLVNKVPTDGVIMTQNNLAVRFDHYDVKLLRINYEEFDPKYIVLDLRDGQNPNNFFNVGNIKEFVSKVKIDPNYEIFYKQGEQVIYSKIN